MNTFIANEEPQWIELGGGQRRKNKDPCSLLHDAIT